MISSADARGRPYSRAIARLQRLGTDLHTRLFRASGGRFGGRLAGGPVLLLTTTGRKSGKRRTVPLLYLRDGEDFVLVASNGGTATHPAWLLNLRAHSEAVMELPGERLSVRAREVGPEERERLWPELLKMYRGYEAYRRRTDREIPLVKLRLVS